MDLIVYALSKKYTKSEIEKAKEIGFTVKILDSESKLPQPGDPKTIYLVKDSTGDTYTQYIWDADTQKYRKVGGTGIDLSSYYKKTEVDEKLDDKQDLISDLATIRSGAALGATALQQADKTELQNNITQEVNAREAAINAVNESINQEAITREQADTTLQNNINAKQDKLTAGDNIAIENNVISAPVKYIQLTGTSGELTDAQVQLLSNNGLAYILLDGTRYDFVNSIFSPRLGITAFYSVVDGTNIKTINCYVGRKAWELTAQTQLQTAISDLDTIRAGAALGATAIQEHQDISGKQDKLTAGSHISIDAANKISSSANEVSVSATGTVTDEIQYITIDGVEKKIAGGTSKIGHTFTTNVTVGNLPSGTYIQQNETVGDILYRILYGTGPVTSVDIYYGATTATPSALSELTKISIAKESLVPTREQHIVTGDEQRYEEETPPDFGAQYTCFAVPNGYSVTKWVVKGTDLPLSYANVSVSGYKIYYLDREQYDRHLGGNTYMITVSEG